MKIFVVADRDAHANWHQPVPVNSQMYVLKSEADAEIARLKEHLKEAECDALRFANAIAHPDAVDYQWLAEQRKRDNEL